MAVDACNRRSMASRPLSSLHRQVRWGLRLCAITLLLFCYFRHESKLSDHSKEPLARKRPSMNAAIRQKYNKIQKAKVRQFRGGSLNSFQHHLITGNFAYYGRNESDSGADLPMYNKGYDEDGNPIYDTPERGSSLERECSDLWPDITTASTTSHDYDPDKRGEPVKTTNLQLQKQLAGWLEELIAINETENNVTKKELCRKFALGFVPLDMSRSLAETYGDDLFGSPESLQVLLKDVGRCVTGQGVKELLDDHTTFAGFRFWELTAPKKMYCYANYYKCRVEIFFAYHQGEWRLPTDKDWNTQGPPDKDGNPQAEPELIDGSNVDFTYWVNSSTEWDPNIPRDRWDPTCGLGKFPSSDLEKDMSWGMYNDGDAKDIRRAKLGWRNIAL